MKNLKRIAFVILILIEIGVLIWNIPDYAPSQNNIVWIVVWALGITVTLFIKSERLNRKEKV